MWHIRRRLNDKNWMDWQWRTHTVTMRQRCQTHIVIVWHDACFSRFPRAHSPLSHCSVWSELSIRWVWMLGTQEIDWEREREREYVFQIYVFLNTNKLDKQRIHAYRNWESEFKVNKYSVRTRSWVTARHFEVRTVIYGRQQFYIAVVMTTLPLRRSFLSFPLRWFAVDVSKS